MDKALEKKINYIFEKNKGYATTKELYKSGVNWYYINAYQAMGNIERVKRGFYKLKNYDFLYNNELVEVSKIVPQGIICLTSALAYYELTTYNPWQYEVAIERNSNIVLPEYPPIKLVYFSRSLYELGVSEFKIENYSIRIYDIEKTICDCIRYRNKIGVDLVKESLKEYVNRDDKKLEKLMEYAKKCRVYNILKQYLEVLV